MSKFFFFFFLINNIFCFSQQITIYGKIKDNQNRSVERASVFLSDENDDVITYSFTDENGDYILTTHNSDKTLKLKVSSLNFQSNEIKINPISDILQNFILEEKIENIEEVLLDGRKIKMDQDTTYIKVASFTNKTEQTVEDILKKLPGIEVLKDGTIKAHGKNIDKLLIEGEDLFDKNYKILSKNLDSKVIDEVQILDNFEDNPIFKKFNNSDKVALNLKLKKGLKNIWFGNINLGSAIFPEERWKETLNIGLLKNKIKLFYFGDYNNLGEKSTNQIISNVIDKTTFSDDRFEYNVKSIFNIPIIEVELFSKTQSIFNESLLNSLSINSKIKKNLTLRAVLYIANDNQKQNSFSITNYNLQNNPFTTTEENYYKNKKTLSSAEIELKYYPNEKNYIKNLFIVKNDPSTTSNNLLFNDSNISQNYNIKNLAFYNHFNHTLQLTNNKILNNYVYFGNNNLKENTFINSSFLNDFLNLPINSLLSQNTDSRISYLGYKAKLISKFRNIDLTNSLQTEYNQEELKNILLADNEILPSYQNEINLNQSILSSDNTIRYNFSRKIDVTASLNFQNVYFVIGKEKSQIFTMLPSLYFNLKKTKIGNFVLSYSENTSSSEINQLNNNFQLSDYRTFQKGLNSFKNLKNQNFSFLYYFYNDEKRYSINANLFYINSKSIINTLSELTNDFIFNSSIFSKGGNNYNFNLSFVNYIRILNLASKIETNNSWSNNPIAVNSNNFTYAQNAISSIKYSATTYFNSKINFDFGISYNFFKSRFQEITTKNSTKDAFINVNFKFSKSLILESNNSIYHINKQNYFFNNVVINYNPIDSKLSYRVLLNNLSNENQYTSVFLDNYTSNTYTLKLVPRYFLFSVKYRF
jgi:hypothetical protein